MFRFSIFTRRASTLTVFSHPPPNLNQKQLEKLTTTELLIKLGFISQPNAGLTNWLPLGLDTIRNIEKIIHKRHKEEGCVEVELSSISNEEIWTKTNRWNNNELFKIDEKFCLAATAEEEITSLVTHYLKSYKKLPFIGYQITRKYRNEIRSRGGLLRGREFLMKDAYSFDSNKEEALFSFNKMNSIYEKIFNDLKLPWIKANADSGDIGGDLSYEWHIISDIGEDKILKCDSCGNCGNVERIRSLKEEKKLVDESDVSYYLNKDNELLCIYYPKGRILSLRNLKEEELVEIDESKGKNEKVLKQFNEINEENDNLMTVYRLIDVNVGPGTKMPDLDVSFKKNHMITFQDLDLTESQEGDSCINCETGKYNEMKGVEVGHTFYLGTKYSEPLNAKFIDKEGEKKFFEMGCYGIGVSRIVGVIAEILRDSKGLRWPSDIAPLQVSIIPINESNNTEICEQLVKELKDKDMKVEIDDSTDIGFGKKLNKSKMIGVPLQVIIGKNVPIIEIETRGVMFSEHYKQLLTEKGNDWEWTVEGDKHRVHVKYAANVIEALLKDM